MPCTATQLESNRKNALRSTGPRTLEGKARSRANGLKHGLTGEGIVLPTEDLEAVNRLFATLEIEMAPKSEAARQCVKRVALMSVRLDRSANHEAKAISFRMRRATSEFDEERLAEIEKSFSWLASEPATHARRLRTSPEGIDRIVEAMELLKTELTRMNDARWTWQCCEHFHHLMGKRRIDVPTTRAKALGDAVGGDFSHLETSDGAGLVKLDRQGWAAGALIDLIDAEVAKLQTIRAGLDLEGLELDRTEAPMRAVFDPSTAAILARKYEAAAERALYRAHKEFRELQAAADLDSEALAAQRLEAEPNEDVGSPLAEPSDAEDEANDPDIEEIGDDPSSPSEDEKPSLDDREEAVALSSAALKRQRRSARMVR